ncbi:hypothetical protein L1987_61527 [Smallanthus sonchifolius]|uniref:Uncharacterized protein n=1 Tax=Smallanthus sonchifolius TaxID=185202 RepID=A0ACB9C7V5_9ASTR|nr:hypothetical protein L1987_61527 [Smallanthus sonchifolius]
MKQIVNGGGGGRGRLRLPTEEEVEVVEILLSLPELIAKSELINRQGFTWGGKKKRSELGLKSESSPATIRQVSESTPEKLTAGGADKSPSTPLCFLPSGSGSDGSGNGKPPSPVKKSFKRKVTDDLVESYNRMLQEQENLMRERKAMKTLHQELASANLELKAMLQKVSYSRNIEDIHQWNNSIKTIDQKSYHPQITMFAPPTPQQHHQHCQQLVVDPNNGKLVAVSSSGNSHGGGRFGLFNQVDPRVKINGEAYDVASSQPLDQSQYSVMDSDVRARNAAAARKNRISRMKANKNALMAIKLSKGCR